MRDHCIEIILKNYSKTKAQDARLKILTWSKILQTLTYYMENQ